MPDCRRSTRTAGGSIAGQVTAGYRPGERAPEPPIMNIRQHDRYQADAHADRQGCSVSGSRGLVTERDISLARIRWRVEVHEGNAGSERGRAGRSCRSGRRDGVQRRAGLTGAAFPSLCWLAPCPAYFCARSTSSATAAPRTGGRSVLSSQHGGLSRPALSGGSTPGRRIARRRRSGPGPGRRGGLPGVSTPGGDPRTRRPPLKNLVILLRQANDKAGDARDCRRAARLAQLAPVVLARG